MLLQRYSKSFALPCAKRRMLRSLTLLASHFLICGDSDSAREHGGVHYSG